MNPTSMLELITQLINKYSDFRFETKYIKSQKRGVWGETQLQFILSGGRVIYVVAPSRNIHIAKYRVAQANSVMSNEIEDG